MSRRKMVTGAKLTPAPRMRNHIRCYDFVHDRDAAGRVIRYLTVKDEASADALAVVPARAYNAADVRAILERLVRDYSYPAYLRSDRGSESMAVALHECLAANRIQPAYLDAGKPWQNGSSESFNGALRRGCLNRYEFHGIEDAAVRMEQWRRIYNEVRPHSRLGYWPPAFAGPLSLVISQLQTSLG